MMKSLKTFQPMLRVFPVMWVAESRLYISLVNGYICLTISLRSRSVHPLILGTFMWFQSKSKQSTTNYGASIL